jgi:hypothetical protein
MGVADMSTPKPRETCRNLVKLVSLRHAEKSHRNQRNHFLKEGGELVSPLARGSLLRRSTRNFAPLALRSRYVLAPLKG